MRATTWIENVARKHGIKIEPRKLNPERPQKQQVEFGIVRRLADGWIREKVAQRFHFRRGEGWQVPDMRRTFLSLHPRGNAERVAISLLFFGSCRFRKHLIATTNQPSFLGRIGSRTVTRNIDKQLSLSAPGQAMSKREIVCLTVAEPNREGNQPGPKRICRVGAVRIGKGF